MRACTEHHHCGVASILWGLCGAASILCSPALNTATVGLVAEDDSFACVALGLWLGLGLGLGLELGLGLGLELALGLGLGLGLRLCVRLRHAALFEQALLDAVVELTVHKTLPCVAKGPPGAACARHRIQ